jgi:hypothetical protein
MSGARWSGIALVVCGCGHSTDQSFVILPEYFGAGSRLVPIVASAEGSPDYLPSGTTWSSRRGASSRALPTGTPGFSCSGSLEERDGRLFISTQSGCGTLVLRSSGAPPLATEQNGYFIFNDECRADVEVPIGPESVPLEVVPPAEFVAGQLGPGAHERSPGMKAWTLSADDGAWEIRGFFDAERGAPCAMSRYHASASDRCLPRAV